MHLFRLWAPPTQIDAIVLRAALFVLSLVDPQWIEGSFGHPPESGGGNAESLMLRGGFLMMAALVAALAWCRRRHLDFVSAGH